MVLPKGPGDPPAAQHVEQPGGDVSCGGPVFASGEDVPATDRYASSRGSDPGHGAAQPGRTVPAEGSESGSAGVLSSGAGGLGKDARAEPSIQDLDAA